MPPTNHRNSLFYLYHYCLHLSKIALAINSPIEEPIMTALSTSDLADYYSLRVDLHSHTKCSDGTLTPQDWHGEPIVGWAAVCRHGRAGESK